MSSDDLDDDGFPITGDHLAHTLFRDDRNIVWVCVYEDHPEIQDWVWVQVGAL